MVIKGGSVSGAARFAAHLERTDTNEIRNEVIEMRDVAATDLRGALLEMEAVASACPNCKKPLYQASINTQANERLTDEQRMQAVDRLEKELGLTGQPRVVVVHEKNDGREHCHVVWSRIDLDKMRAISDSHNYRKHEIVARELEREFGHERVQGAHIERDGKPRPPRTPSHKEIQQGARTGVSPKQAREHLTALWQRADNGKAFAEGLAQSGWILARGDRRDFVAVDQKGGTHSLSRRIDGATAKMVRERLADLKPETLPSVAEARATQQARHAPEAARQAAPAKPRPKHRRGFRRMPSVTRTGSVARQGGNPRGGRGGAGGRWCRQDRRKNSRRAGERLRRAYWAADRPPKPRKRTGKGRGEIRRPNITRSTRARRCRLPSIKRPCSARSSRNPPAAKNCSATMAAKFRRKRNRMRRSSAITAIEAAGESASARLSEGAGHPSDGQKRQPRKRVRRQSRRRSLGARPRQTRTSAAA